MIALDYVAKTIIIIAVIMVMITFIYKYSSVISEQIEGFLEEKPKIKGTVINSNFFTTSQLKNYISSCAYLIEKAKIEKDYICYTLIGNVSSVNITELSKLEPDIAMKLDLKNFNKTKNITIIWYKENYGIIVESP